MDVSTNLTQQVKDDYLAYSMAVLVGRAIPSLYDGMKPVHRRILTAMKWLNLKPDGKFIKSARVEGEVMGKLHPHGSAYGAIVTLASPWNNNLPLITGHGNFGSSVDGAAASRYTECKLSPFAWDCLLADSETWETMPNYDGSLQEPTQLNVKVPALLLNGQEGIGVGYATRIPQHNLRDVCEAITKGTQLLPSFSTGCDIIRDSGLDSYTATGVGTLRLRARCETTEAISGRKTKTALAFTNLPPTTNPEKIGQQIKDALDKGTLSGITEVRDESDLTGDRIVVAAKPGTDIALLERQLFYHTDLESAYPARNLCVDGTQPVELSSSQILARWQTWRLDRLGVRFRFELDAKEQRLEIVRGLIKAIEKIDAIIQLIRSANSRSDALVKLVDRPHKFTRDQADAILDMRLSQLTNLDSESLREEEKTLIASIETLTDLIANEKSRRSYMLKEIREIGVRHGEKRRSALIDPPETLRVEKGSSRQAAPARPRFLQVDMKKGVVSQAKGPRGALVLEKTDKLIAITHDGTLKKVPSSFKGPLGAGFSPVVLAKKESDVLTHKYLVVFALEDALKAMVVSGEDLAKVTSKGKCLLPPGATLVHFGEGNYEVPWLSPRKKTLVLNLAVKAGKPGGKGVKVAALNEVSL
jgi:DNA gyrase subunit A